MLTAKSRATLTPPAKSHSALISLGKNGIEGVIYRVQLCPHPGIGFTQAINEMLQPWRGSQLNAISQMTNADAALYRAKAEMRGSVLFFEPEMSARLRERCALKEDLRSAIDRGELLLHYQPQKKMSGETVGFEALVRWQCPKRGPTPLSLLPKRAVSSFR